MTGLTVALAIGACYRLTMLVTSDAITARTRRWLTERWPAIPNDCAWCMSMYVAAPVAWSGYNFGDRAWWAVSSLLLTCSAVTGITANFVSPES